MSTKRRIQIYDTTLRDGAQGEGISFSAAGKIQLARRLDAFGVDYIEGGYPGSNPKDIHFFQEARKLDLKHARIAAFGSTRRAGTPVGEDHNIIALLNAETPVITLVGKSWSMQVREVLRTTAEENLAMIGDSVRYLKERGKEVFFDAEHFFQGYQNDPAYAVAALQAAAQAGADGVVLCDTNGGTLSEDVYEITRSMVERLDVAVGIHTHNDIEQAVATSLAGIRAGAGQVQGTINGYGERCGNANLISIIPTLRLKMGLDCLHEDALAQVREVSVFVDELLNRAPDSKAPYVGRSAFGHKAGLHANAVQKNATAYEHIDPELVGNARRFLVSEGAGGSSVILKAMELGMDIDRSSPEVRSVLAEIKELESKGYEFEAADASFKLLVQKVLNQHKPFFELEGYRVMIEKRGPHDAPISEATVKLTVQGEREHTVAEADGPVDALDRALRRALTRFYPEIADVYLTDFRVRILDPEEAASATTRVLIESSDGEQTWTTVGVSDNIIEASWEALVDSVEHRLFLVEKAAAEKTAAD